MRKSMRQVLMAALVLVFAVSCSKTTSQKETAPIHTFLQDAADEMVRSWQIVSDNDSSVFIRSPQFLVSENMPFCAYNRVRILKDTGTTFKDLNSQFLKADLDVYFAVKQDKQNCEELDSSEFFQLFGTTDEVMLNNDMQVLAQKAVNKFWLEDPIKLDYSNIENYEHVGKHCLSTDSELKLKFIKLVSDEYDEIKQEKLLEFYMEFLCFNYEDFDWKLGLYIFIDGDTGDIKEVVEVGIRRVINFDFYD